MSLSFFLSTYYDAVYRILLLDSQLPPCSEFYILSFGWFPGFWILCVDVSEHSVSSIFIGDERTECIISLGDYLVSEFYVPTFRNNLSLFHLLRKWRWKRYSVPKLRYIKFWRRGLSPPQKKEEYNKYSTCLSQPCLHFTWLLQSRRVSVRYFGITKTSTYCGLWNRYRGKSGSCRNRTFTYKITEDRDFFWVQSSTNI
jgi:hypothetical protein